MSKIFAYSDNIIGLNVHHKWTKHIKGHNCEFSYYRDSDVVYDVYVKLADNETICKFTLFCKYSQCYSGWTTATRAICLGREGCKMGSITHIPKKFTPTNINKEVCNSSYTSIGYEKNVCYHDLYYSDDIITFTCDGEDEYYPNGDILINMDYFKETGRGFDKPVTWLVTGGSLPFAYNLEDQYDTNQLDSILYKNIIINVGSCINIDKLINDIGGTIIIIKVENDSDSTKIFVGDSNMGKSFIAHKYSDSVYETDSDPDLNITNQDIIVVGNKYNVNLDNVMEKSNSNTICRFYYP